MTLKRPNQKIIKAFQDPRRLGLAAGEISLTDTAAGGGISHFLLYTCVNYQKSRISRFFFHFQMPNF